MFSIVLLTSSPRCVFFFCDGLTAPTEQTAADENTLKFLDFLLQIFSVNSVQLCAAFRCKPVGYIQMINRKDSSLCYSCDVQSTLINTVCLFMFCADLKVEHVNIVMIKLVRHH